MTTAAAEVDCMCRYLGIVMHDAGECDPLFHAFNSTCQFLDTPADWVSLCRRVQPAPHRPQLEMCHIPCPSPSTLQDGNLLSTEPWEGLRSNQAPTHTPMLRSYCRTRDWRLVPKRLQVVVNALLHVCLAFGLLWRSLGPFWTTTPPRTLQTSRFGCSGSGGLLSWETTSMDARPGIAGSQSEFTRVRLPRCCTPTLQLKSRW